MPGRLEKQEEDSLCERVLINLGIQSIKLNLTGNRGWPDRLFLLPMRPVLIEFKRPGEKPEPLQRYRLKQLSALGYDAYWTDNYEAAYSFLKAIHTARLSEARHSFDGRPSVRRIVAKARTG